MPEPRQVARRALGRNHDAVARHAAPLHQLTGPAHVAEARQMAREDDADAKPMRFANFRKANTGGDAVDVQHVRPFVREPAIQLVRPRAPARGDRPRRASACRKSRSERPERRRAGSVPARVVSIGRRDQHIVPGGTQPPAQPFDVHLGAADAVREIPPEEVGDLHSASVAIRSNTLTQAATTSSQSRSVNAAEIGRRISEAATRSVTGRSTDAMSPHACAYGAECSGT